MRVTVVILCVCVRVCVYVHLSVRYHASCHIPRLYVENGSAVNFFEQVDM